MFIYCFKTILVFQWILQSYDGVLVSQEVAIQSDKKVDLPFSPTSLHNFLQVFLSLFLCFDFHLFHSVCCIQPRKRVVVVPRDLLQCRWCLCRIGVWSATFDLYKRLCPRREDLKLVQESSGQKFCPFLKSDLKGNGLGFIQQIETVVYVNTLCKQKVFFVGLKSTSTPPKFNSKSPWKNGAWKTDPVSVWGFLSAYFQGLTAVKPSREYFCWGYGLWVGSIAPPPPGWGISSSQLSRKKVVNRGVDPKKEKPKKKCRGGWSVWCFKVSWLWKRLSALGIIQVG